MTALPNFELPDPFRFNSGASVRSVAHWGQRRLEILQQMVPIVYGELPPAPKLTRCVDLHAAGVQGPGAARQLSCRVEADGRHAFVLRLFVPAGPGPFPVLLSGDACWRYASEQVIAAIVDRRIAFAQFDRLEIAHEDAHGADGTLASVGFAPGQPCAALAAWAWGFHRAVDVLAGFDFVDRDCIAVVGHSRGGKAALMAGATDERIMLTSANNSGACGAGSFRWQGQGSETLAEIVSTFPNWFGPRLKQYAGREHELPFDQHFLKALIAPRALLTTEGLDDHFANPAGTWQTHLAAREVYAFLGVQERIVIAFRQGGHYHSPADWRTLLDFCDLIFRGQARADVLEVNPFSDLPAAFSWNSPAAVGTTASG